MIRSKGEKLVDGLETEERDYKLDTDLHLAVASNGGYKLVKTGSVPSLMLTCI